MATLVLRLTKGSPLSNTEADQNLININNELVTKLPSTSYTASDVLAKLVTVDGTGSGVDADLLDGLDTSSILPVAANKSSVVTRDSSGNFTANTITATVTNANNLNGVTANGFISRISINNHIARVLTGSGADIVIANGDGVSGNPTISAGSNLAKRDSTNTYNQVQNFSLITANGILNDGNNNIFAGVNNLSLASADGFLYVPTVTGIPSGIPTTNAGRSPIVWDATNNKMWVYSGGQWNSQFIPTLTAANQPATDNSTNIANTSFVQSLISPINSVINNRNAVSDITLLVGQVAYYDVTSVSSVALKIATGDLQDYEINWARTTPIANSTTSYTLQMNNTTYGTTISLAQHYANVINNTSAATIGNQGTFALGVGTVGNLYGFTARAKTNTASKQLWAECRGSQTTAGYIAIIHSLSLDLTTPWTSLGTINFGTDIVSGRITVRRIS